MADNPYLRLVEQQDREDRSRLEISMDAGSKVPAERTAQAIETSRETGVPVEVAQRTDVPRKNPYLDVINGQPQLREWLSDPVNASLAQGEEEQLSWIDRQMDYIPRSYERGQNMISLKDYRLPELYAQLGIGNPLTEEQQKEADRLSQSIKEGGVDIRLDNIYEWLAPQIAEQVPIMGNLMVQTGKWALGGAAAGGTAGNLMPGVGTVTGAAAGATAGSRVGLFKGAFELEAALAWDELRNIPGVDPQDAAYASIAVGGVNGLLESAFGPEAMINPAASAVRRLFQRKAVKSAVTSPTVRAILVRIGKVLAGNFLAEGATETLQEFTPAFAKSFLTLNADEKNPITYDKFVEHLFTDENTAEWLKAGLAGGVTGAAFGGVMSAPSTANDIIDYRRAKTVERSLLEMGDRLAKTRSAPEYVGSASQDNVYVDVSDWDTYWQSQGVEPEQAAVEVLGDVQQYKQAAEGQHQLSIPMGKYARTLGKSEHNKYFASVIRVEPDQMNAREAEQYIKEKGEQDIAQVQAKEEKRAALEKRTAERLMDLGHGRETAETNAKIFSRIWTQQAEVEGRDVEEIIAERGLDISQYALAPDGSIVNQIGPSADQSQPRTYSEFDRLVQEDMFSGELADENTVLTREVRTRSSIPTTTTVFLPNQDSTGRRITGTMQGLNNFWDFYQDGPVDANGRPILLYHSTNSDISAFEVGRTSTNNYGLLGDVDTSRAGIFATPDVSFSQEYLREGSGQNVMPVYMALQNPIDLRKGITEQLWLELEDAGLNPRYLNNVQNQWELFDNDGDGKNELVDALKKIGYDGAIIVEDSPSGDTNGGETYIAFDPAQIKSAIGNRGTFDPSNPNILMQSGSRPGLDQTYNADNTVGVTVGGVPGRFGWSFANQSTPPPVEIPTQKGPRVEVIGEKVAAILSTEGMSKLAEDAFGIKGLKVTRIEGSWEGNPEPSYFLTADNLTFEQASALSKMLGFAFAQDAVFVSQPYHAGDQDAMPAVYIGSETELTEQQLSIAKAAAKAARLDYSTTADGRALKFLYIGKPDGLDEYIGKVIGVADAAGLPLRDLFSVKSELNNADSYLTEATRGVSGPAWIADSTAGSPDLFRAVVDNLIVPYARAVGAEGYRFDAVRFAERFGLPRHKLQVIEDALLPQEGIQRSTVPILYGDEELEITPTGHNGKPNVTDVLWALQNRAAQTGQIKPGDYSDRAKAIIAETIADEVAAHITREGGKSAIGWYDAALKKAKKIYNGIFPVIKKSKEKAMMFDAFLGIASQGNDVFANSIYAARMFDLVAIQGKSITEAVAQLKGTFGSETVAIENNYLKYEALTKQNGPIRIRRLFNERKTVGEWNALLRSDKRLHYKGKPLKVEGAAEQEVTGWMVFGPKIGSFINNLHGDYSTLTADLWFSRTWNRILGYSFVYKSDLEASNYQSFVEALVAEVYLDQNPKMKDGKPLMRKGKPVPWQHGNDVAGLSMQDLELILTDPDVSLDFAEQLEARYRKSGYKKKSSLRRAAKTWVELRNNSVALPRTDLERNFQQKTMEEAQALIKQKTGIDITIADMQAALWYHEKELFGHLGVKDKRSEPADYADAAKETVALQGEGHLFDNAAERKLKIKKAKAVDLPDVLQQSAPSGPQDPDTLLQRNENAPRGFMQIRRQEGAPSRLNIGLLENADLSTFMHETAHAYLEVMRDFVGELQARLARGEKITDRQRQYLADSDALLKWLGIDDWSQLDVDRHEQFARGFEAYLMEGKAPSPELRTAFHRFKIWLTQIYKQITSLNVKLSDEVRGVMDRMIASQEEIEAARQELQIRPIFLDATSAGMSEAQFANYRKTIEVANAEAHQRLEQAMYDEWVREQKKWWKEETARMENEVEAELLKTRPFRTIVAIATGKLPDGREVPPVKLSRRAIEATYGDEAPEILAALKKHNVVRIEDSISPDEAAQLYGYGSGDEMVRELARTPGLRAEVRRLAGDRMRAEHGDMMRDAGLRAQEARMAVLNERQEQVLEAELKALHALQRAAAPMLKTAAAEQRQAQRQGIATLRAVPGVAVFKQIAEGRISQMRVRDLQPNTYLVAMRKAAKASEEALARQDYVTASAHKQAEALNLQMYLLATKAKAAADKQVAYLKTFSKKSIRERLGKTDYLTPIDAILSRVDLINVPLRQLDWVAEMQAFLEKKAEEKVPIFLPPELAKLTLKKNYKEMTVDELTGINDAVKHLDHMSRHQDRLLKAIDKLEFDELKAKLIESARERGKGELLEFDDSPQDVVAKTAGNLVALHRKPSFFIRLLDGFKDNGFWHRNVLRPMNEAANRETSMKTEASEKMRAAFARYMSLGQTLKMKASKATLGMIQTEFFRKVFVPELKTSTYSGNASKANLLMIALNLGNEGNKQRLLDGYGWDEAQVMKALDKHLTRDDWAFVEEIWSLINGYWPEIAAMHKRVYGVEPGKVDGIPVRTKYGVIQGAYFPIKYDSKKGTSQFFKNTEEAAAALMSGEAFMAQTKSGHREARVSAVKGQPISLDIDVIAIHLNNVIHDLTHFEAVTDVNRILRDGDIKREIISNYGEQTLDQLNSWLQDSAAGDRVYMNTLERGLLWMRTGVSVASLGLNLLTAALQTTGYLQSIVRLRPEWAWAGLKSFYSHPFKMSEEILGKSEFMRNRSRTLTQEINEALNTIKGGTKTTAAMFALISKMQATVDFPTWQGAYLKAIDSGMKEPDAVSTADQAVRDTQMGGQTGDIAGIMRGNGMAKLFTVFMSYMNTTFNLASETYSKTDFTKPREIGLFIGDMLLLYTLPAALGMMIRDMMTPGDDDDDDKTLAEKILREQASMMLGQFVGLRELSGMVQGYGMYQGPAGTRIFGDSVALAVQIGQGDVDQAFLRSANRVGGIVFHYPALQVDRTVRGVVALAEGETDNPLALVAGPPRN